MEGELDDYEKFMANLEFLSDEEDDEYDPLAERTNKGTFRGFFSAGISVEICSLAAVTFAPFCQQTLRTRTTMIGRTSRRRRCMTSSKTAGILSPSGKIVGDFRVFFGNFIAIVVAV